MPAIDRRYRLGHDYRDTGSLAPDDEIMGWVNIEGSGIRNMGGIRPLRFTSLDAPTKAYIILVTHERSRGTAANPWDDLIDLPHGRIVYWGDAKFHETKGVDDWVGNQALKCAWDQVIDNTLDLVPPILHFSKNETGSMHFNGLCVLERLDLTWFEDHGRPVRNYRAHLAILGDESVEVDWLHRRATAASRQRLTGDGPPAWRAYQSGLLQRLRIWAPDVRATPDQLPTPGSPDSRLLQQLVAMSPTQFEAAVVALFREMSEVQHEITRTKPTGDGGFDFYGKFTFPPPLRYEIDFLGEAKKFAATTAVTPGHVSRLVARLARGQYGVFVTTSYFTRQAQEEVLADGYPTTLVAGSDLVRVMRELRVAHGSQLSATWLQAVEEELGRRPVGLRAAETRTSYGPD
jgi:Restriction endonuclease AspBHI N-terminal/Restriction endonuclease